MNRCCEKCICWTPDVGNICINIKCSCKEKPIVLSKENAQKVLTFEEGVRKGRREIYALYLKNYPEVVDKIMKDGVKNEVELLRKKMKFDPSYCSACEKNEALILSQEEYAKKYPCPCGGGCGRICNVP